jgi:ElaB/YqjD/DUF883 family membrane-anchored ribosome-binding protein
MGWFSRKKPAADPPRSAPEAAPAPAPAGPDPEVARLVQRWDGTIADVQARLDQVLAQATAQSEALLPSLGTDLGPLSRIWSATEARYHEHGEEVSDGWDAISDELSELDGCTEEVMDREGSKRDRANTELEIRYTRAYRSAMARAAEQMRQRVQGDPDGMRIFAASGALMLGQWEGQGAWEAMKRVENRVSAYRERKEVPLELLSELEATSRQYWTTTLTVEAQHAPEQQQYLQAKIERYMHDVEKTLRQYWQWRQKGG